MKLLKVYSSPLESIRKRRYQRRRRSCVTLTKTCCCRDLNTFCLPASCRRPRPEQRARLGRHCYASHSRDARTKTLSWERKQEAIIHFLRGIYSSGIVPHHSRFGILITPLLGALSCWEKRQQRLLKSLRWWFQGGLAGSGVLSGLMVVLQVEGVVPKRQRLLMAICSEGNLFNEDGCWGDLTGGGGA